MAKLVAFVALLCVGNAIAHSWLGCADYRGPVDYYDDTKCFAYPRNWETARAGALTQVTNGYQLGADTGYNYQGGETTACQLPMASPVDNAYTTKYPKAVYEQGQTYCLAWPMKNHGAATCTNQYIPDTSMKLFRSAINPTTNPTQTAFKANPVSHNFGVHTNQQIDCLGFQRAPKFCDNTDRAMATGCFSVPATQAVGTYIYQWYWIFNDNTAPYTTCWDAQVVAAGTGRGGGGLIGATTISDNLQGAGTSGATCRNNWATAGTTSGVTVATAPSVATSTGNSAPSEPVTDTQVALNGDSIRVVRAPATITTSGVASFDVTVSYSATGPRAITVDILDSTAPFNWHGKGVKSVTTTNGGTVTTIVTVEINVAAFGPIVLNSGYILRAWFVSQAVFDDYLANPSTAQPWTQEMDRDDSAALGAATTTYTTSFVSTGASSATTTSTGSNTDLGAANGLSASLVVVLVCAVAAFFGRQ